MERVRIGAVSYLNTRPLVWGLESSARFDIRFDVPAQCAALLHEEAIDVGLIPSIEYLRGRQGYRIVPDLSLASRGAVDSVALYSRKAVGDIRTVALDTSSRTSIALLRVLGARLFRIDPEVEPLGPDLEPMLARCDAALIIGDNALFLDHQSAGVEKIDLGEAWFTLTGLPFVYAFWAGRPGVVDAEDMRVLQAARDEGVTQADAIARRGYPGDPRRQAIAVRYLVDNMKYGLGAEERAGLETFYRYAAELGLVPEAGPVRFF